MLNEPDQFRHYLKERRQTTDLDDKAIQAALDGARTWLAEWPAARGGSLCHLAMNYLKDGFYHP